MKVALTTTSEMEIIINILCVLFVLSYTGEWTCALHMALHMALSTELYPQAADIAQVYLELVYLHSSCSAICFLHAQPQLG